MSTKYSSAVRDWAESMEPDGENIKSDAFIQRWSTHIQGLKKILLKDPMWKKRAIGFSNKNVSNKNVSYLWIWLPWKWIQIYTNTNNFILI